MGEKKEDANPLELPSLVFLATETVPRSLVSATEAATDPQPVTTEENTCNLSFPASHVRFVGHSGSNQFPDPFFSAGSVQPLSSIIPFGPVQVIGPTIWCYFTAKCRERILVARK